VRLRKTSALLLQHAMAVADEPPQQLCIDMELCASLHHAASLSPLPLWNHSPIQGRAVAQSPHSVIRPLLWKSSESTADADAGLEILPTASPVPRYAWSVSCAAAPVVLSDAATALLQQQSLHLQAAMEDSSGSRHTEIISSTACASPVAAELLRQILEQAATGHMMHNCVHETSSTHIPAPLPLLSRYPNPAPLPLHSRCPMLALLLQPHVSDGVLIALLHESLRLEFAADCAWLHEHVCAAMAVRLAQRMLGGGHLYAMSKRQVRHCLLSPPARGKKRVTLAPAVVATSHLPTTFTAVVADHQLERKARCELQWAQLRQCFSDADVQTDHAQRLFGLRGPELLEAQRRTRAYFGAPPSLPRVRRIAGRSQWVGSVSQLCLLYSSVAGTDAAAI